jgi:hypothetical protein
VLPWARVNEQVRQNIQIKITFSETRSPPFHQDTNTLSVLLDCGDPGKRTLALKPNSRFWCAWALTRDINYIRLYRSCYYIDPMKSGLITQEWVLARDTTLHLIIIKYVRIHVHV